MSGRPFSKSICPTAGRATGRLQVGVGQIFHVFRMQPDERVENLAIGWDILLYTI